MLFHIQRTDIHCGFQGLARAGRIAGFQKKLRQLKASFISRFGIRHELLQRIDSGFLVAFLQICLRERFVGIVLIGIFRIHLDGFREDLDGFVCIALRQCFLARAHELSERFDFEVLHFVVHGFEELCVELLER